MRDKGFRAFRYAWVRSVILVLTVIHGENPTSAEQVVRAAIAAADRRRRVREASRFVWRVAPGVTAAALLLAAIGRWSHWPVAVPAGVLIVALLALIVHALLTRRARPVSDATAAAIDGDAGLGGELRSASWFARRTTRDAWADFHLAAAASRVAAIDWAELYPSIRAPRAKLATLVFTVAALALMTTIPGRNRLHATATASSGASKKPAATAAAPGPVATLDPELQKLLEELLASAAAGTLPTADALATNAEMRDLLSRLNQLSDRELLEALKRALAANPDLQAKAAAENLKALAGQADRSAEGTGLPPGLQEALDKLSDEIELARPEPTISKDPSDAAGASSPQQGEMAQSKAAGQSGELSIQFAKEADAGGASGVLMMSQQSAQAGGPPGSGVGGSGSQETEASAAAMLDAALKKEMVEASQDNAGENVDTDIRRKTEHGNATIGFTGAAAGTFDRTRVAAPPPVPEARRTGVQTYFVRKPQ